MKTKNNNEAESLKEKIANAEAKAALSEALARVTEAQVRRIKALRELERLKAEE